MHKAQNSSSSSKFSSKSLTRCSNSSWSNDDIEWKSSGGMLVEVWHGFKTALAPFLRWNLRNITKFDCDNISSSVSHNAIRKTTQLEPRADALGPELPFEGWNEVKESEDLRNVQVWVNIFFEDL